MSAREGLSFHNDKMGFERGSWTVDNNFLKFAQPSSDKCDQEKRRTQPTATYVP